MFVDVVAQSPTSTGGTDLVGALFASDSRGTALELILPDTSNTNYGADVEAVANIDGVIVANQVTNADEVAAGLPAAVRTLISFDEGGAATVVAGTVPCANEA